MPSILKIILFPNGRACRTQQSARSKQRTALQLSQALVDGRHTPHARMRETYTEDTSNMSDASEETDLAPIAVPPALPPPPLPLASAAVRDDDDDGAPASAAALLARVEAHLARADAETGANDDGALLGELAAELRRMAAAERAPAPRTPVGKAAHGASGTPRSLDLKAVAAAAAKAAARAQRTKARTAATGAGAAAAEAVELSGEQVRCRSLCLHLCLRPRARVCVAGL